MRLTSTELGILAFAALMLVIGFSGLVLQALGFWGL